MTLRAVVRIKHGEARIVSTRRWDEYRRRKRGQDVAALNEGACEEACVQHGGVVECGRSWVECGDGSVYLIDP